MQEPSIKGTAFLSAVQDLQRLLEEGRVTRDELEVCFEAADLALIDKKILPSAWYPIETYRRFAELLRDREGGGRDEYLIERGARAADRLMSLGLYRQFESMAAGWTPRAGEFMLSLSQSIYNFARWTFHASTPAEGAFQIEVTEAEAFPHVARLTVQGAIQHLSSVVAGEPVEIESERPTPDRIVYTVRRPSSGS